MKVKLINKTSFSPFVRGRQASPRWSWYLSLRRRSCWSRLRWRSGSPLHHPLHLHLSPPGRGRSAAGQRTWSGSCPHCCSLALSWQAGDWETEWRNGRERGMERDRERGKMEEKMQVESKSGRKEEREEWVKKTLTQIDCKSYIAPIEQK